MPTKWEKNVLLHNYFEINIKTYKPDFKVIIWTIGLHTLRAVVSFKARCTQTEVIVDQIHTGTIIFTGHVDTVIDV